MQKIELSELAKNVAPSPTLAVDSKAKALKAAGEDVCGFGAGEPDFDTPNFIKEACIQALRDGKTKYCPAAGLPDLRKALAEKYIRDNHIMGVDMNQVVVSPGGKFSCYLAILAVCGAGDEVIIPAPYWVSYPEMVKLSGATPVTVLADDAAGFKITPEQLRGAITDKTKMLILNSPSNPTGAVYSREEVEALVEVALEANIYILSDEIYEYLLYDGVRHTSPASLSAEAAARTITVGGFSKSFSMTGWRLGSLMAHPDIAKAVIRMQGQMTSNATTFAQWGALAALQQFDKSRQAMDDMLVAFDRRRCRFYEGLKAVEGVVCERPKGAFYLFPNISSFGLSSVEFATKLLEEEKVAVVPGSGFDMGNEGTDEDKYTRFSYATSDAIIEEGLTRFARFCNKLNG